MASQRERTTVGVHLVGGLDARDAEEAMRLVARILGDRVWAIPDGETGERQQWITWQIEKLTAIDGIDYATNRKNQWQEEYDQRGIPSLEVDAGLERLPTRSLGYADVAEHSYGIFCRLRDEAVIPAGVKFQVSVGTPYATVVSWVRPEDQERFLPIYTDALAEEVRAIADVVGDDLLLQYDVAVEIGVLTGATVAAGELSKEDAVAATLKDAFERTPAGVEQGVHLCYGDYQNRHFAVPGDLSLCVRLANTVADNITFAHMPVDRDTGRDPRYFEALKDLAPVSRLALGVIDYDGDDNRVDQLIEAANEGSGGREFAVATECGMARIAARGGPSLERLLEMHARVAAPIR